MVDRVTGPPAFWTMMVVVNAERGAHRAVVVGISVGLPAPSVAVIVNTTLAE